MRPVDVRIYREDGIVNEEIARLHRPKKEEILRLYSGKPVNSTRPKREEL